MARLTASLGRPVSIRTENRFPEGGGWHEVTTGVDWPEMTLDQANAALGEIEASMAPAESRGLAAALLELWLTTAHREHTDRDREAIARIYIRNLQDYPADIAMQALRLPRQWWPSWAELAEECDRLVKPRRWLKMTLERKIARKALGRLPAFRAAPKGEERVRCADMLRGYVDGKSDAKPRAQPMDDDQLMADSLESPEARQLFWLARMAGKSRPEAMALVAEKSQASRVLADLESERESA